MFLDYSKLHIKFLKYQLLIYSPVKRYWFPDGFSDFFGCLFWQLQALHEIAIAFYIKLQKRNSTFTLFT